MELVFEIVLVMVAIILAIVALVGLGRLLGKPAKGPRRAALAEATLFMEDGQLDPSDPILSGRIDGHEVTFRLVTRHTGHNIRNWTECEVVTATDQLDIALRPQTRHQERWVDKGLARDVVVGDHEFDDKFIVEAAPVELAKRALGATIRAELLAHHPLEVKSRADGLLVEKRDWIERPGAIRAFAEMCAHLASAMQAAVAEAGQDDQSDDAQAGYRGASQTAQRGRELTARAQTDELKALRERRERTERTHGLISLGCIAAALFAWFFVHNCL